jgi:hypothetical protein
MVDRSGPTDVAVVDGLDAVAVWVEQKAAVVVLGVLRPWSWRTVVPISRPGAGAPELVDELPGRREERDVKVARDGAGIIGFGQREVSPDEVGVGETRLRDPERLQHRVVEAP